MATGTQVFHMEKRVSIAAGLNRHITRQQFVTVGEDRIVTVWVPDNADPSRTAGNVELVSREFVNSEGQKCELTLQQAVDKRIRKAGIKPRNGQATCLEIIFSGSHDVMVAMNKKELRKWADDTLKWAQKIWGKENVVSASFHVDERTPHIHMIVVPIVSGQSRRTRNQKLNADLKGKKTKTYKIDHNKLRLCANEVYTTGKLYWYHDNYAKEVSIKYGLDRGVMAEPGSKKNHLSSEDYNRLLNVRAAEQKALVDEITADYKEKKAEFEEDIQQLQENKATISAAVEDEKKKLATAEAKTKETEERSRKAEARLSSQEEKISTNAKIINNQVADFNARKIELDKTVTDIKANEITISDQNDEIDSNQQYLNELKTIKDEISRKKVELQALSSLDFWKMILDIPKRILAEIQERIKGYWKGIVTSYEEVQYSVEDGPNENFAKINIKNGDKEYYIEVREKTGNVYLNGAYNPYKWSKTGEEMMMPELAEFFRTELTPDAKQYVESLYKKPTKPETVWQSKQILGKAEIIKNAENDYTLKTWDRDFKRWEKVADCVGYSIKSDNTYDYITVTLANGRAEYYNQFGNRLTEKQRQRQGLGGPNIGGGRTV